MNKVDDPARRLGLAGPAGNVGKPYALNSTRSLLSDLLKSWRQPSLSLVLLLAGLQNYFKRIWALVQHSGAAGFLPGFGGGATSGSGSDGNGPLLALGAWASLTVISFVGAKFWSLYNYLDPLNTIFKYAYIDSRHTTQVESHKWLTCIIEASPKYKRSRDLDASNFQSVREKTKNEDRNRYDRYDSYGELRHSTTKVLEVIHDPTHSSEVPVYFQPRDVDDFWFFKFGTLFRVTKRAPRNVRRPSMGFNPDYDDWSQAEPAILVRAFCRTRKPLMKFLAYAQQEYEAGFRENLYLQTFTWDDYQWNASAVRMGRGFETIIIPEEIKAKLLDDVQEFLDSQDWYSARGIPWKRGYLFHGPPGNGKSSSIAALASTFDLPVYTLPIASAGFSDSTLSRAVSRLTSRCILVLEDLDALTLKNKHRNVAVMESGTAGSDGITSTLQLKRNRFTAVAGREGGAGMEMEERLSLSAILNTLDGIDCGEGRIVIATTNSPEALDPALIRPGRFDCFIHYKKATREQARALFLQFYKDYKSKAELPNSKSLEPDEEFAERARLGTEEVKKLAAEFQSMVEEEEFSVAALQGHLIAYKINPYQAVKEMSGFLAQTRNPSPSDKLDALLKKKFGEVKPIRDSIPYPGQLRRGSF